MPFEKPILCFLHGHHVRHWADGGETSLSNLVTLSSFQHTLVHEGGYDVCRDARGDFVVTRPDGKALRHVPASRSGSSEAIGFDVPAEVWPSGWDGSPVSDHHIMSVFAQVSGARAAHTA